MLTPEPSKLDRIVVEARRAADARALTYREQALKIYPWICGRCAREFRRAKLRELTVHHRDHNHDNNPPDGSHWEFRCLYCRDNKHHGQLEAAQGASRPSLRGQPQPTRRSPISRHGWRRSDRGSDCRRDRADRRPSGAPTGQATTRKSGKTSGPSRSPAAWRWAARSRERQCSIGQCRVSRA
jgi:hypothetical protein